MKTLPIFPLWILQILISCNERSENDDIQKMMTGTYTRVSQQEFGTLHDTVVISLLNESANVYKVTSKWRYDRILDGKPIEPEYKTYTNSAIFNEGSKLLRDNETGYFYSFDIEKNILYEGATKYQKLK